MELPVDSAIPSWASHPTSPHSIQHNTTCCHLFGHSTNCRTGLVMLVWLLGACIYRVRYCTLSERPAGILYHPWCKLHLGMGEYINILSSGYCDTDMVNTSLFILTCRYYSLWVHPTSPHSIQHSTTSFHKSLYRSDNVCVSVGCLYLQSQAWYTSERPAGILYHPWCILHLGMGEYINILSSGYCVADTVNTSPFILTCRWLSPWLHHWHCMSSLPKKTEVMRGIGPASVSVGRQLTNPNVPDTAWSLYSPSHLISFCFHPW